LVKYYRTVFINFFFQNLKRKGYPEGLEQLENTPDIAAIEVRPSATLPYL
jgi:hypothetical protein